MKKLEKLGDRKIVKSNILISPFLTNLKYTTLVSAYIQYFQRDSLFTDQNTFNHLAKNDVAAYGLYKRIRICLLNKSLPT